MVEAGTLFSSGIRIHAGDAGLGEKGVQLNFHLFRSESKGFQTVTTAGFTRDVGRRFETAIMANQAVRIEMKGQGDVAVGAAQGLAA